MSDGELVTAKYVLALYVRMYYITEFRSFKV